MTEMIAGGALGDGVLLDVATETGISISQLTTYLSGLLEGHEAGRIELGESVALVENIIMWVRAQSHQGVWLLREGRRGRRTIQAGSRRATILSKRLPAAGDARSQE